MAADILQRFLFERAAVRGEIVQLDASWQEVLKRHEYPPAVRSQLGEMMAACLLLSATLKLEGTMTLQVQGDGPISLMVVEATSERTLRGLAHWRGEVPEGDLKARFGNGRLAITIEPGEGRHRYQGIVAMEGQTIAEAIDGYLERSEQLATRMWLAADGDRAAGLLLQKIPGPGVDEEDWTRIGLLAGTLTERELLDLAPVETLRRLFHEEDLRLFDPEPVSFRCSCSRERVAAMLRGLGREEIRDILSKEEAIEVNCEFCNQHYRFDAVDAEQLWVEQPQPPIAPTRH